MEDYIKFHSLVPISYLGKILLKEVVSYGWSICMYCFVLNLKTCWTTRCDMQAVWINDSFHTQRWYFNHIVTMPQEIKSFVAQLSIFSTCCTINHTLGDLTQGPRFQSLHDYSFCRLCFSIKEVSALEEATPLAFVRLFCHLWEDLFICILEDKEVPR